jgi:hypothetical protein
MEFNVQTETITLPSGAKALIREMTGSDEDILTNEKLVRANKAQHQLLGNVIQELNGQKPTGQDVLNMWSADRTAVMLHTRVLSYGPEVKSKHECDNTDCRTEFDFEVDHILEDLELRPTPKDIEGMIVTLPSGRSVTLRAMRGSDEARLLQARQKGELMTELMFSRLVEVEGIEDGNRVRDWLRNAPLRDRTALRKAMEQQEFGYQTQVEVTCPLCNTEQRVDVMSVTDFFFPGSRDR